MLNKPADAKDKRIIEKFLWFPKTLYNAQNIDRKITKWFKKVKIEQRASPRFDAHGTQLYLTHFEWSDNRFID